MKQFPLLLAAIVLSGCMYKAPVNTTAIPKQNFERDNADCRRSEPSSAQKNADKQSQTAVESSDAEEYNVCMRQRGWTHADIVTHNDAYKKEVENQARTFFESYPEYVNNAEKEKQLSTSFQNVLSDPQNQGLSLYQMLLIAHTQLQADK